MTNSAGHFYEFGPFRVDVANLLLFRDGQALSLAPKAVETLIALVQHGGQLLKKDDLIRIVWSDRVVDESNLSQNIYLLRKTLGEGSNGQRYIDTVPRRGYRFVGEVRECNATGTDLILAGRTDLQPVFESHDDIVEQSDSRSLDYRPSTRLIMDGGWSSSLPALPLSCSPHFRTWPSSESWKHQQQKPHCRGLAMAQSQADLANNT
jgi:DNA-binding winged helix-turn-helix (wHTH) protein